MSRISIRLHGAYTYVERAERCWSDGAEQATERARVIVKALADAGLLVDAEVDGFFVVKAEPPAPAPLCNTLADLIDRCGPIDGDRLWCEQQMAWCEWFEKTIPHADAFARMIRQYPGRAPE
jgi:hypothetical protein